MGIYCNDQKDKPGGSMLKEDLDRIANSINSIDKPMHEKTPFYLKAILELLLLMSKEEHDRPKQSRSK